MYKDIHVHIWPYTDTFRERLAHTNVYTQWYIHRHIDTQTYAHTDIQIHSAYTWRHRHTNTYTSIHRSSHMHTQTYANTDIHIQTESHRHTCIIICSCIHKHAIPIDPHTHTRSWLTTLCQDLRHLWAQRSPGRFSCVPCPF